MTINSINKNKISTIIIELILILILSLSLILKIILLDIIIALVPRDATNKLINIKIIKLKKNLNSQFNHSLIIKLKIIR